LKGNRRVSFALGAALLFLALLVSFIYGNIALAISFFALGVIFLVISGKHSSPPSAANSVKHQLATSPSDDRTKMLFEEWKVVMQTQMHFNEMIMRVRSVGVSVVTAVFGAAAYSLQFQKLTLTLDGKVIHVAAPIAGFGLAMLLGLFALDYFYYYRMLLESAWLRRSAPHNP
jgi:hypothetical protein